MTRTVRLVARIVAAATIFALLFWRLGAGPFLDGLRAVDSWALMAAVGISVLTTVCCAWRWQTVARGLGVELSMTAAIAAYYRSMFLNVTLPGGVVGDVHRGVSHGREVSDVGLGLRAVAWERSAGQVIQVALTVVVLLALPSPLHSSMPLAALVVVAAGASVVVVLRARRDRSGSRLVRVRNAVTSDIRNGLLARRAWLGISIASVLVVCGHALTFLIAARTAGATASPTRVLPLALIVMLAMVLPSVGGWGPREGMTAWAFGAAGLGASQGVATAVVYGVMVLVASLPGAAFVLVAWFRRTELWLSRQVPVAMPSDGVAHG